MRLDTRLPRDQMMDAFRSNTLHPEAHAKDEQAAFTRSVRLMKRIAMLTVDSADYEKLHHELELLVENYKRGLCEILTIQSYMLLSPSVIDNENESRGVMRRVRRRYQRLIRSVWREFRQIISNHQKTGTPVAYPGFQDDIRNAAGDRRTRTRINLYLRVLEWLGLPAQLRIACGELRDRRLISESRADKLIRSAQFRVSVRGRMDSTTPRKLLTHCHGIDAYIVDSSVYVVKTTGTPSQLDDYFGRWSCHGDRIRRRRLSPSTIRYVKEVMV